MSVTKCGLSLNFQKTIPWNKVHTHPHQMIIGTKHVRTIDGSHGSYKSARIAARFWLVRRLFCWGAAAAAFFFCDVAIEKRRNRKKVAKILFYFGWRSNFLLRRHNRGAAIEEKWPFLLRHSSIAALRTRGSAPQLERFYTVPESHLRVRKNRLWIVSPSIVVFSVDLVCKEWTVGGLAW